MIAAVVLAPAVTASPAGEVPYCSKGSVYASVVTSTTPAGLSVWSATTLARDVWDLMQEIACSVKLETYGKIMLV